MNVVEGVTDSRVEKQLNLVTVTSDNSVRLFSKIFFNHTEANVWIAGGVLRDYFDSGDIYKSDIDFFASDRSELVKLILHLRKNHSFKHFLITRNAIKGYGFIGNRKVNIDIVKKLFNSMEDCVKEFDFTVCCFAVNKEKLVYIQSAPLDLLKKRLVLNKLPFPLSTFQRVQKYARKGFSICNGGILEISKAIAAIDFENPKENTLELYPDGSPRFLRID